MRDLPDMQRTSRVATTATALFCAASFGVALFAVACDEGPYGVSGGDDYYPGGSGSGSSSGGYEYDAGYPGLPDVAAPEAEAGAASIPPISGSTPPGAPATCADGAAPGAYLLTVDGTLFAFTPGSLELRPLGVLSCPTTATPWTLSVTASDTAYVLYQDGSLYSVDLRTLACHATAYVTGQLGLTTLPGVTVGAGRTADRFYVYAASPSRWLGVSDLTSFRLFEVGPVGPGDTVWPVDLKSDAYGRLFALAQDGTLAQLDPATGAVLGVDRTGFDVTGGGWALMAYDGQLYLFGGGVGAISRYDLASKALFPMGQVNEYVVGASAAPCLSAAAANPSPADAGAPPSDPDAASPPADAGAAGDAATAPAPDVFAPGDAWMGTYVCPQGLTNLAVVVESVDGAAITARFDFDWVDGATQGSYELTGRFDPATREATFAPGAWVSQPGASWSAVGLDGYVDLSGTRYAGNVTYAGCGAFSLAR